MHYYIFNDLKKNKILLKDEIIWRLEFGLRTVSLFHLYDSHH